MKKINLELTMPQAKAIRKILGALIAMNTELGIFGNASSQMTAIIAMIDEELLRV